MKRKIDSRFIILGTAAFVLIVGGVIFGSLAGTKDQAIVAQTISDQTHYDFGNISIRGGVVSYTFQIINNSAGDLKLSNISTSCMCTSAVLEYDGRVSPRFGMHNNSAFWSETVAPSKTARLKVTFDPMAHGPNALGPVTRTVSLKTNNGGQYKFTITANVVK